MTVEALFSLAERVRVTPPEERERHAELLEELCALSAFVRTQGSSQAATCLLAAGHALEALSGAGRLPGVARVHAAARDLLRTVAEAMRATALAPQPDAAPGEPEPCRGGASGEPGRRELESRPAPGAAAGAIAAPLPAPPRSPAPPPRAPAVPDADALERIRRLDGDPLLGRILLELGQVTQAQLDQALAMQDAKGLALGECLLLIGACPPERVLDALKLQGRLRAGFATEDASEAPTEMPRTRQVKAKFHVTADIFLGEVLLGAEVISNDDLERAMHMHYLEGVRVGEALVRIGALTPEALQDGIALQRSLQGMAQKTARPAPGFEAGPPE